jgi:membrane protein YqaA with SNARE-associated domain
MSHLLVYLTLFLAAFLAATILPAQSESVLAALASDKSYTMWILVLVASLGNTLGSVVNWGLGRGLERFKDQKWFPVRGDNLAKAQHWYNRYGYWSLLLSWVPFIGDPITVAAGVMRERFLPFVLIVGTAKTLRYVFIVTLMANLF